MRSPLAPLLVALCVACSNAPSPSNDSGTVRADAAPVDGASDVAVNDGPAGDVSAGDVPESDVPLRNGCPILTDPVDRMGAPPSGDTYADFVRPFVMRFCLRCHHSMLQTPEERNGAPGAFNWDTEMGVRAELQRIRNAVGVANYMPLNDPRPTCEERRRLVRWVDIGAP